MGVVALSLDEYPINMFTGLIETTGTLLAVTPTEGATRITIASPTLTSRLNTGDSIAVNGVCLTALSIEPNAFPPRFSADLAAETIARTTLSHLRPDAILNLELPTPAGSPLGGHVVQGHVDGTGTLLSLAPITPSAPKTSDWRLRLRIPDSLTRYVVPQGSITIEGISLTVAKLGRLRDVFTCAVAVIPHTVEMTNLGSLKPGDPVNLEADLIAKYVEKMMMKDKSQPSSITAEELVRQGF